MDVVVGSGMDFAVTHQLAAGRRGARGMPARRRAGCRWPALALAAEAEAERKFGGTSRSDAVA